MKTKQKATTRIVIVSVLMLSVISLLSTNQAFAATITCQNGNKVQQKSGQSSADACAGQTDNKTDEESKSDSKKCETSILPSSFCGGDSGEGIWKLLNLVINVLTGGVAILAIGGVVYASILYASAGGDAGQVKKAKEMLRDIVIGIAAFALMYSFLQFIIPGGAFS